MTRRPHDLAWGVAGTLCGIALVVMAFSGGDRPGALAENAAGGIALHIAPGSVRAVEVTLAAQPSMRYVRVDAGAPWRRVAGTSRSDIDPAQAKKLNELLMLLHNSTPERRLPAEPAALAGYGLAPAPALRVRVSLSDETGAPAALGVEFGGLNPMGLATYSRISPPQADDAVLLLPAYVADTARALAQP